MSGGQQLNMIRLDLKHRNQMHIVSSSNNNYLRYQWLDWQGTKRTAICIIMSRVMWLKSVEMIVVCIVLTNASNFDSLLPTTITPVGDVVAYSVCTRSNLAWHNSCSAAVRVMSAGQCLVGDMYLSPGGFNVNGCAVNSCRH